MNERLLSELKAGAPFIPTCQDYANLLDYARIMKGETIARLRRTMGLATYRQWAEYLSIA